MDSIGDAWGFSGKTSITLSRGFSVVMTTYPMINDSTGQ